MDAYIYTACVPVYMYACFILGVFVCVFVCVHNVCISVYITCLHVYSRLYVCVQTACVDVFQDHMYVCKDLAYRYVYIGVCIYM